MPKPHDRPVEPDRRSVVLGGAALVVASAVPDAAPRAAEGGLAPAGDLLARANQFLSSLEPDRRKAASFAWGGPEWRGWNYFGSSDFIKPGLRLEQMSTPQKAVAWDLIATVLSASGLEKARNVMTLQDVLAARGDGVGRRSSERFSFAVFGVPAETGTWGIPTRRAPSEPVDRRTRRPDNFGHALLVLRQSQPRRSRNAQRSSRAQGRGGVGAAAFRRPGTEAASQGASIGQGTKEHSFLRGARASECAKSGSRRGRPGVGATRAPLATHRNLYGRAFVADARDGPEGARHVG